MMPASQLLPLLPFRAGRFLRLAATLAAVVLAAGASPAVLAWQGTAPTTDPRKVEFFERRIRPLLASNCFTCHSADTNSRGGLRLDDRNGILDGGGRGAAIVPGSPDESLLIRAVRHVDAKLKMPPEDRLSEPQIDDLRQWIQDGAAWTPLDVPRDLGSPNEEHEALKQKHWAWQPVRPVAPPKYAENAWVRDDIDRFVLARLEAEGLAPVADADERTLLRRVTFDLTGLPPTPEAIAAFTRDSSPAAFEKLVDSLLESPAFGERWGRHWLDVARYGESTGSARNLPYPHAWRYRDYVIDSLNRDKPFDQFVREQIAGDLLPARSPAERTELTIATGFLAIGVKDVNQRFKARYVMDNIDEQLDTIGRGILGLTVGCARCHDHKFDPIPTTEYYALAGIFQSTDLCAGLRNKMGGGGLDYYDTQMLLPLDGNAAAVANVPPEKVAEAKKEFEQARAEFQAIANKPEGKSLAADGKPKQFHARQKMNRLQADWLALSDPAVSGPIAIGVRDAKVIGDTEVRLRGEAEKLGPRVPRGFLTLLAIPDAPRLPADQSGRKELADWLTHPANPLTTRVAVNRAWRHLFGQGLVRTVDNFGTTGDLPSHPELLDHLATRFVAGGWSLKKLVRAIVLTHTYQLGTDAPDSHRAVDPGNRWLWRHSPRRLDAEEMRDAMLLASGKLSLARPDGSPAMGLQVTELRNNGPEARQIEQAHRASLSRSVYLPLLRLLTPTPLEVFDFAEQGMVTGSRETTTVAPQALYLLNDAFVRRQSLVLAEELMRRYGTDEASRVTRVYQAVLARDPTAAELQQADRFLAEMAVGFRDQFDLPPEPAGQAVDTRASVTESAIAGGAAPDSASRNAATGAVRRPAAAVANPDEPDRADEMFVDDPGQPTSAEMAALASFCQALFATGEFRYVR